MADEELEDDVFVDDAEDAADAEREAREEAEAEARKEGLALIPEVNHYRWEPQEAKPIDEGEHHAAILFKGGKDFGSREIGEEFDFLAYVTNPKVILKADDNRMTMGETGEDLQRRLDAKHPAPPGCSRLLYGNHELHVPWEPTDHPRHRERHNPYKRKTMRGWVALKYPVVVDYIDLDQIRKLSMEHGPILLREEDANIEKLMEAGFSPVGGGHGLTKVRWNPKAVALRHWRKAVKNTEAKLVSEFDQGAIAALTKCFNPTYWPRTFPFQGTLGHSDDFNPGVHGFHNWIALARKLKPGSTPWREVAYSGGSYYRAEHANYAQALEALLPFVRTVQKRATCHIQRKLVRFILAEAKALKLTIPPMPNIPDKPFSRKVKKKPLPAASTPQVVEPEPVIS